MTDDLDFYDLLGVQKDASTEEIREQFREQVRRYHPDLNDDPRAPAQFTALKKAYDTLADESERKTYDRLGHEEYVRKRITRLPSPESWEIPERDEEGSSARERDERREADQKERGEETAGEGDEYGDQSPGDRTGGGDGDSPGSIGVNEATTSSNAGGGSVSAGRTRATERGRTGGRTVEPEAEPTIDPEPETIERPTGGGPSGAGTARDPDQVWTPDGWNETETDDDGTKAANRDLWSVVEDTRVRVETAVSETLGWPLIAAANVLYLGCIGLYLADSAAAVERLVAQVRAAGADLGALGAALGTRPEGLSSLSEFILSAFARSGVVGTALLVGITFLPTVYFFMVRWTRNNDLPWQPSYMYVAGALAPVVGLALSVSFALPGVFVEVIFYFLIPGITIFAMLFFGQIKPHAVRFYRRWQYRRRS